MKRLIYMSIAVLFLLPLWSMQVSVGEVNSAESALVAIGQGQYEYDGAIYAFKSEYQTKLYNYLSRDDVDLSQSEVNDYVSQFYGNLASACTSQYMYKVSDVEKPSPAPTPAEPSPAPVIPGETETPTETDTPVETEAAGEETNTEEPVNPAGSQKDKNTEEEAATETEPEETEGEPVTLPAVEEKTVVLETETVPETEIAETEEKKDYSHAERVDNRFRFEMVIGVIVVAAVVVLLLLVAGKTAKKKKWHRD